MKNICALLLVVQLAAASVAARAQEAGQHLGQGDLPPLYENPSLETPYAPMTDSVADGLQPMAESLPPGDAGISSLEGSLLDESMRTYCPPTSLFESSGTWLRRGYWYTEADFLFLNRGWERKGLMLAGEVDVENLLPPNGQFQQNVIVSNELRIRGERPGGEGVGRLKLGRFLFRDSLNRDHSAEVSWYGGGEWSQQASLNASTAAGLDVTDYIDRVNPSFDGARSMAFQYDHEMNSLELNYLVRQRMHRDQMVMQPNGAWVRKATPTRTLSYLAGARYMSLREVLNIQAEEIPVTAALDESGFYHVTTDNDLIGTQIGIGYAHETSRWSIAANVKAGAYINRIDLNSDFQVGETNITNSGRTTSNEDDLSFIGEAQLLTKWHLRPNMSLRAGLELMFVDSIALAPFQVNFIPGGYSPIAASGDSVYLGTSIGLESYW